MNIEDSIERRSNERYKVSDDIFLTFRPHFEKMGRIRDISRGGVAFEYIFDLQSNNEQNIEVDIFSTAKDLHLARVPCKVVYDVQVESYPSFSNMVTKRCGLQFRNLNKQQMSQLSHLFTLYTPPATQ